MYGWLVETGFDNGIGATVPVYDVCSSAKVRLGTRGIAEKGGGTNTDERGVGNSVGGPKRSLDMFSLPTSYNTMTMPYDASAATNLLLNYQYPTTSA